MKLRSFFLLATVMLCGQPVSAALSLKYSTLLGGSNYDASTAVAVGGDGSIYVTGNTGSTDFPSVSTHLGFGDEAFVTKLTADGRSIVYSTLIGGIFPRAIAVDASGQVYLAGYRFYNGLPVKNAVQETPKSNWDAVLLKLNAAGSDVLFGTYFGGNSDDGALALALDGDGDVWIAGVTASDDFPLHGTPFQSARAGSADAFLAQFSNDGTTVKYSTYFGGAGSGETQARALVIDSLNRPILFGRTTSPELPLKNAFQTEKRGSADAFITKFETTGQSLVFSTYFGGSSSESAIAMGLDSAQNIFIHGVTRSTDFPTRNPLQAALSGEDDFFLTKLSPDAMTIAYSTYLGSPYGEALRGWPNFFGDTEIAFDVGGLAVTPSGRALVANHSTGPGYPLQNAVRLTMDPYSHDAVATLLDPDGAAVFSTYLGGTSTEAAWAAAATPAGDFIITGLTYPEARLPDFPVTPDALQKNLLTENGDAFVVKMSADPPVTLNDHFSSPAVLEGWRATSFTQTDFATKEPGEPDGGAAGEAAGKSAWFRWTAPLNGRVRVHVEATFETWFTIYTGSSLATLSLFHSEAISNGDIEYDVEAGQTLQIGVDGSFGGSGAVSVSLVLSLPFNDDFDRARVLSGTTASDVGSTVGATTESDEPWPHSVWWNWLAPASGAYTLNTVGSEFDTALVVYKDAARPNFQFAFSNGYYTNNLGRITFPAEAGASYQFAVLGEYGSTGLVHIAIAPAIRPPNDDFANRTRLSGRNEHVTGSQFDAVYDPSEADIEALLEIPRPGRILWWQWTAPIDGAAFISTEGSVRMAPPGEGCEAYVMVFEGDSIPTSKDAFIFYVAPNYLTPASVFLPSVRAGARYQIGLDATDWQQPVQFMLNIRAIAPPRIIAGSAGFTPTGNFTARVEGIEGTNYRVTTSTDLKTWTKVADFPAISGEFSFETAAVGEFRFYRVEEY